MINVDEIKNRAEAMGLTIAALERRADLANGIIGRWETSRSATVDTLKRVADVLGCTMDDLITKETA